MGVEISDIIRGLLVLGIKKPAPQTPIIFPTAKTNLIRNGNFSVNQFNTSSTGPYNVGAYVFDAWRSEINGTSVGFLAAFNRPQQITIISGQLSQIIDFSTADDGVPHYLTWEGTSQCNGFDSPLVIPDLDGAPFSGKLTFGPGTLANVVLTRGSEYSPTYERSYREDLRIAQRFYWKSYGPDIAIGNTTGGINNTLGNFNTASGAANTMVVRLRFPEMMAATPVVTFYNPVTGSTGTWRYSANDAPMYTLGVTNLSAVLLNSAAIPTVNALVYGHLTAQVFL